MITYTRQVLGLEEYLIGVDRAGLDYLSTLPAIKPAIGVLYTGRESKVDIGALYIDCLLDILPGDWEYDEKEV